MPGPRSYNAATRAALAALSGGTCYFPDCTSPIIVFLDGDPYLNADIAHITDARPGNRYDPAISDASRASFANLILLCRPHHTLVDKAQPSDFPAESLRSWKRQREAGWQGSPEIESHVAELGLNELPSGLLLQIPLSPAKIAIRDTILSPYQVLWPRFGVIPFDDHSGALDRLLDWCRTPEPNAAIFLDGSGGAGKTRTAVELCTRLASEGWLTGFYSFGGDYAIEALLQQRVPRLLVFDYANDRPHQIVATIDEFLARESAMPEHPNRFLFITRSSSASDRTRGMTAHQSPAGLLIDRARTIFLTSSSVAGRPASISGSARRRLYMLALQAIVDHLGAEPIDDVPPDLDSDTFSTPLFVVFAALLAGYEETLPHSVSRDEILQRILHRESSLFWVDSPETDVDLRAELVCIPTLAPIESEADSIARLAAIGLKELRVTRQAANWLHRLYPGDAWANPLEPDLLGEFLLAHFLNPLSVDQLLSQADRSTIVTMLHVVSRTMSNWTTDRTAAAVDGILKALPLLAANWLEAERSGDVGAADGLEAARLLIETLPLPARLPKIDVPGRLAHAGKGFAVVVAKRLLDDAVADGRANDIPALSLALAQRLDRAGNSEEARRLAEASLAEPWAKATDADTIVKVVQLLLVTSAHALSASDGEVEVDLALQLLHQLDPVERRTISALEAAARMRRVTILRNSGRTPEAIVEVTEALKLRRGVALIEGDPQAPALAASLRVRASLYFQEKIIELARRDIDEAIGILKSLPSFGASVFDLDLAKCLELSARIHRSETSMELANQHSLDAIEAKRRVANAYGPAVKIDLLRSLTRRILIDKDLASLPETVALLEDLLVEQLPADLEAEFTTTCAKLAESADLREFSSRMRSIEEAAIDRHVSGLGRSSESVKVMLRLAGRSADLKDFSRALSHLHQGRDIARQIGNMGQYLKMLTPLLTRITRAGPGDFGPIDLFVIEAAHDAATGFTFAEMSPHQTATLHGYLTGWIEVAIRDGNVMLGLDDSTIRLIAPIQDNRYDQKFAQAKRRGYAARSSIERARRERGPRGSRLSTRLEDNEVLRALRAQMSRPDDGSAG